MPQNLQKKLKLATYLKLVHKITWKPHQLTSTNPEIQILCILSVTLFNFIQIFSDLTSSISKVKLNLTMDYQRPKTTASKHEMHCKYNINYQLTNCSLLLLSWQALLVPNVDISLLSGQL